MGVLRDKWERKALGFTTEAQDLQLCRGVVTDPTTEKAIEYMWRSAASRHTARFFYLSKKSFQDDKLSPNLHRIAERAKERELEMQALKGRERRRLVHAKALAEAAMREGHDPTEWGHANEAVDPPITRQRSIENDKVVVIKESLRAPAQGGRQDETVNAANASTNTPGPRAAATGPTLVRNQRPPVRWRWSNQQWEDPARAALREHEMRHLPARTMAKHGPASLPFIGTAPGGPRGRAAHGQGALGRRSVAGNPEWIKRVRLHEQAHEELARMRQDPMVAEEQRQTELMMYYQQEHQKELRRREKKKGIQGLLSRGETPDTLQVSKGHRSPLSVRMSG